MATVTRKNVRGLRIYVGLTFTFLPSGSMTSGFRGLNMAYNNAAQVAANARWRASHREAFNKNHANYVKGRRERGEVLCVHIFASADQISTIKAAARALGISNAKFIRDAVLKQLGYVGEIGSIA